MNRAIARRSGLRIALTLTLCAVARDHMGAGQLGKIFGRKQEVTYQTYRDSSGRFSLEYPNKDWRVVPGGGSAALVILAREDGEATVVVEASMLVEALAPSEIQAMAEIEVDNLKARLPAAKDAKYELVDTRSGRGAMIPYANIGAQGPERVVQYSIPVEKSLFRLIRTARVAAAAKHDAVLAHMIESFKSPAEPAPPRNTKDTKVTKDTKDTRDTRPSPRGFGGRLGGRGSE
jgi:hypothetical protein